MMSTSLHAYWSFGYFYEVPKFFAFFFQLGHFLYVVVLVFLSLNCRSSSYIMDINPLSDISSGHILPEYVPSL